MEAGEVMGRKRWRERRAAGRITTRMFDVPDVTTPRQHGLSEKTAALTAAIKASGISGADVRTPRLLCGADLGDGLTCRRMAGHERVGPDCSPQTLTSLDWAARVLRAPGAPISAFAAGGESARAAAEAEEREATERALNAGTSLIASYDEAIELAAVQTDDDRVIAEGIDHVIQDDLRVAFDESAFTQKVNEAAARLEALPPVSNPAPGLWEIVTGKPLPSYAELVERGRRADHPTYDLLNVQSTRAPQLSSAEACDRLAASIGRTQLARRITEVLPPALASQLALAVDEAVRRGIAEHVATERAVLAGMAEGAQARLAQSIEDQKRGREANAERFSTPSRLS